MSFLACTISNPYCCPQGKHYFHFANEEMGLENLSK